MNNAALQKLERIARALEKIEKHLSKPTTTIEPESRPYTSTEIPEERW